MAGRKQRDKHGRFKGKGGIKAYKSNLPKGGGRKRTAAKKRPSPKPVNPKATPKKGMSKKQKAAGAALLVGATFAGVAAQRHMEKKGLRVKNGAKVAVGVAATALYLRSNRKKKKAKK